MDDTHLSRTLDAAATRKRRSSILKSQRPPRAPFSDLEFNVATPTDTTKSRRVSFSRRTGVAEFATNEATTTWKTFYEEHNKTLESSGNESEVNPPRPSVGHLGRGIFDQQFQVEEAVDLISTLGDTRGRNIETSLNSVNFADQLAALECTSDNRILSAPQQNFELSAFTDHQSKLFGDDLAISGLGELTDRIGVNFSAVQTIVGSKKDDLDEIQLDLQRAQIEGLNVVCPGPFRGQNISGYLEVDLNTTNAAMDHYESDMSITDTIASPKVQGVTNSNLSLTHSKKPLNNDWNADKENIVVNPYVAPKETANFAINEESDKVLVFDGKRLTVEYEKDKSSNNLNNPQVSLPNVLPEANSWRKKSTLNRNDDFSHCVADYNLSVSYGISRGINVSNPLSCDNDMSFTRPITSTSDGEIEKRKTILFDNNVTGNISMTQTLPTNIILPNAGVDKRKTNVCDDSSADLTGPQVVSSNVILNTKPSLPERRQTIVYEDDAGNISITQAVPTNIFTNTVESDKRRTIVFDTNTGDISLTQAVSSNLLLPDITSASSLTEKRKTIIFEDDSGNISVTEDVPNSILPVEFDTIPTTGKTIVYGTDAEDISVTEAVSTNIIYTDQVESLAERRNTRVYEDNQGNISITQSISNLLLPESKETIVFESEMGHVSVTRDGKVILSEKITAMSHENVPKESIVTPADSLNFKPRRVDARQEKRKTIVYEDDAGNISITQAVPQNLILADNSIDKSRTLVFKTKTGNISVTHKIDAAPEKRRTIVYESQYSDISITQAVPANILIPESTSSVSYNKSVLSDKKLDQVSDHDTDKNSTTQSSSTSTLLQIQTEDSNEDVFMVEDDDTDYYKEEEFDTDKEVLDTDKDVLEANKMSDTDVQRLDMNKRELRMDKELLDMNKEILDTDQEKLVTHTELLGRDKELDTNKEVLDIHKDSADIISAFDKLPETNEVIEESANRKTKLTDSDLGHMSLTKPIPTDYVTIQKEVIEKSDVTEVLKSNQDFEDAPNLRDVFVYQTETDKSILLKSLRNEPNDIKDPTAICANYNDLSSMSLDSPKQKLSPQQSIQNRPDSVTSYGKNDNSVSVKMDVNSSILHDLLDMSNASMEGGLEDKNIMAKIDSVDNTDKTKTDSASSDSLFFITRDSEDETQTDKCVDSTDAELESVGSYKKHDKKRNESSRIMRNFHKKILQLKHKTSDDKDISANRHFEKVISFDLKPNTDTVQHCDLSTLNSPVNNSPKQLDRTKDIIEMLSEFTDREEKINPVTTEDKTENNEQNRVSIIPKRVSIAISREDLMNNISMAQAILQKSRVDIDDETIETTANETIEEPVDKGTMSKKCVRMSDEVVKTLRFEEESSGSEESSKDEDILIQTPLKKTAFGEDFYMKESKVNVIPTYLKDVSDGIKQLMSDLVKPMADVLPFESHGIDKGFTKAPSTCSLQVQANLYTSSQIDIDPEPQPETSGWATKIANAAKRASQLVSWDSPDSTVDQNSEKDGKMAVTFSKVSDSSESVTSTINLNKDFKRPLEQTVPGRILVFDHHNPLNNVLFNPIDYSEVHGYNPIQSNDSIQSPTRHARAKNGNEFGVQRLSTQYVLQSVSLPLHMSPTDAISKGNSDKITMSNSLLLLNSQDSKPLSTDQSIDAPFIDVKDTEVNTIIVMKGNNELLEASSSLTLVDDALVEGAYNVDIDSPPSEIVALTNDKKPSPVKVIYKSSEPDNSVKMDSDITSNDDEYPNNQDGECTTLTNKTAKRSLSPSKHAKHKDCTMSSLEVTPKPNNKQRKMSNSPSKMKTVIGVNRVSPTATYISPSRQKDWKRTSRSDMESSDEKWQGSSKSSLPNRKKTIRKTKTSPKNKKPGASITVQQIIAEYQVEAEVAKNVLETGIIDVTNDLNQNLTSVAEEPTNDHKAMRRSERGPDDANSFTSSNNQNDMRDVRSVTTVGSHTFSLKGNSFSMDWQPELINELSSKNLVTECESSVNVVAKIDMLPFMGTRECEWEASGSDSWTFRLLHGRLRLNVRLAHRHDNASRTCVRADTPVLAVTLETTQQDKKNAVAVLCVRYAAEAMRYFLTRGCARAGDVPALLRRCAGVARVALRWGRAMHDAYTQLAYTLSNDGRLALKVANIPLRSVWEVTMQMVMVVDDAREVPWPGATDVCVNSVVTDYHVSCDEVRRALAHVRRDWGNVPRTVWKIFKYLKHKTRDDDLLLGLQEFY